MLKSPQSYPEGLWTGYSFVFIVVFKIKDRWLVDRVERGTGKRNISELLPGPDLPILVEIL